MWGYQKKRWNAVPQDENLTFLGKGVVLNGMATFEGPMLSIKTVNGLAHYTDWIVGHVPLAALGWNGFMAALESMGAICELSSGLWLLRTRHSAGIIRNALSQTLEQGDRFVVVDASRDRFAWFNLGPEVDVRVSKVWNGPLRAEAII